MENKQLCLSFSREACMPPEICTVKNGCTYSPLIRCNQTACSKGVFFKHFEVYTLFFNKAMVNIHHCPMGLLIAPIQRLQKLKSSPWTSSTPSSQINISTCRSKPLHPLTVTKCQLNNAVTTIMSAKDCCAYRS